MSELAKRQQAEQVRSHWKIELQQENKHHRIPFPCCDPTCLQAEQLCNLLANLNTSECAVGLYASPLGVSRVQLHPIALSIRDVIRVNQILSCFPNEPFGKSLMKTSLSYCTTASWLENWKKTQIPCEESFNPNQPSEPQSCARFRSDDPFNMGVPPQLLHCICWISLWKSTHTL